MRNLSSMSSTTIFGIKMRILKTTLKSLPVLSFILSIFINYFHQNTNENQKLKKPSLTCNPIEVIELKICFFQELRLPIYGIVVEWKLKSWNRWNGSGGNQRLVAVSDLDFFLRDIFETEKQKATGLFAVESDRK